MYYSWNVIGHAQTLAMLEQDFLHDNIAHAYLFTGPEKVGKFRVAKTAAQILQCPRNFCRNCPTCFHIEKKMHGDTMMLEDDGESIKIQTIRDIIARLMMTSQSRYKILLVQNAGRFTSEAASALLKILEEPPPETVFLFTAIQLRDVMPTISSRMRIVPFKKLSDEILRDALKDRYPEMDEETMNQVLLLSLGRSGRALQLLENPEMFQEVRELYRHVQFLDEKAGFATRFQSMQEMAQNPEKLKTFFSLLTHYFRDKMLNSRSAEERLHAVDIIEKTHRTIDLLGGNVNARLALEYIMLALRIS